MRRIMLVALAALACSSPSVAKKKPGGSWKVTRTSDPITGTSSCVVAAFDRAAGMRFTRTGALYPFIEQCSVHGLLIGVGSGGRARLPTGMIIWRVDDRPFRTLSPADGPVTTTIALPAGADAATKNLIEQQQRLIAAATATSAAASGEAAQAMLRELVAGDGLLYRAVAAAQGFGLPNGASGRVGMITKDGLRPVPIDESFRAGLVECNIPVPE